MNILLLGGSHEGRMVPVAAPGDPIEVGGETYRRGANLPGDIKSRLPHQTGAWDVAGYVGPDEAEVAKLKSRFPVHEVA
jgi:hypothetical protein